MSQEAEDKLKRMIEGVLSDSFEMSPEVKGKYLPTGKTVYIDYILRPKPELINRGFKAGLIGLEVKSPELEGDVRKAIELANQAMDYAESEFEGFGKPDFILIFPVIEKHFKRHKDRNLDAALLAIRCMSVLMQKRGVGGLDGRRNGDSRVNWQMRFGMSHVFWDCEKGKGNFDAVLHRDRWRGSKS